MNFLRPCMCAGYTGDVLDVSSIGYSDPGMTNSNMQVRMSARSQSWAALWSSLSDIHSDAVSHTVSKRSKHSSEPHQRHSKKAS